MKLLPIVMVKNEEVWIERVLRPLINAFPVVVVGDTGSTDSTLAILNRTPGELHIIRWDKATPQEVGRIRQFLQDVARFHEATHVMLVDGDELYTSAYVRFILENPMPENAPCGFTSGIECTELENGECWTYDFCKSRDAVFSVDSQWHGVYPFEGHSAYNQNPELNYYWKSDNPAHHFYHLHGMRRSSLDGDVHLRLRKKNQFNMQDRPDLKPTHLWLKSEKDYKDEY